MEEDGNVRYGHWEYVEEPETIYSLERELRELGGHVDSRREYTFEELGRKIAAQKARNRIGGLLGELEAEYYESEMDGPPPSVLHKTRW